MSVLAAVTAGAVLLPPAYLLARAAGRSGDIWGILSDDSVVDATWRTVILCVTVTASTIALAVPLAWLTVRTDLPLRRMWAVILSLPLAIPSFIGGFIMVSALGPGGMFQDLLEPFGVDEIPSIYGFRGAWLTLTLFSYPYVFLTARAGLARADRSLEEAARTLGRSPLRTFLTVNLPQLRPSISAGGLLVALYVLSEFGAVAMLRFDTLTPLAYVYYTTSFDRGAAAIVGIPLLLLAVAILGLDLLTRGRGRYHPAGHGRPPSTLRLGRWRWPAFAACALVALVALGIPVAVLVYWLARGLAEGESTSFVTEAVVNSVRGSAAAAVLTVVVALPIAFLAVRRPGWPTTLAERSAYVGQALPGITVALALVFFAANYATPVYQTFALLVVAYALRFLPEALGTCRAAVLQVNSRTEEAARSLGAGSIRVFRDITFPQLSHGLSAGALLVFLTAMKELQITLLLSPVGFDTLATQVWSASREAFFTQAALPALVLVGVSSIAVALLLRREQAMS